jgi:hypothetical protein
MSARTLRTSLLNTFAHLNLHGASFAEGDIVLDDPYGTLFTELCERGFKLPGIWWEITLTQPLECLCSCLACTVRNERREAVRFRRHADAFVIFRLQKDTFYSMDGMLETMRIALWGAPPTGEGCTGGYRSSDAARYETASRHLDEALHAAYKTTSELSVYNRKYRLGNELYTPIECWTRSLTQSSGY